MQKGSFGKHGKGKLAFGFGLCPRRNPTEGLRSCPRLANNTSFSSYFPATSHFVIRALRWSSGALSLLKGRRRAALSLSKLSLALCSGFSAKLHEFTDLRSDKIALVRMLFLRTQQWRQAAISHARNREANVYWGSMNGGSRTD